MWRKSLGYSTFAKLVPSNALGRSNHRVAGLGFPIRDPMLFEHAIDKVAISRHQTKLSKKHEAVTRQRDKCQHEMKFLTFMRSPGVRPGGDDGHGAQNHQSHKVGRLPLDILDRLHRREIRMRKMKNLRNHLAGDSEVGKHDHLNQAGEQQGEHRENDVEIGSFSGYRQSDTRRPHEHQQ